MKHNNDNVVDKDKQTDGGNWLHIKSNWLRHN